MDREAFEQLVSEWLDTPARGDLRARIDAALAAEPALAELFEQWRRLDGVFRENLPQLPSVKWPRLARRISRAVDREAEDAHGVDEVLRRLPGIDRRVDWQRVGNRIADAVAREAAKSRRAGGWRRFCRIAGGVAAVATVAAVLVLSVMPNARPERPSAGRATFAIGPPRVREAGTSDGVATVAITVLDVATAEPERFFMIDPMTTPAPTDDVPLFY